MHRVVSRTAINANQTQFRLRRNLRRSLRSQSLNQPACDACRSPFHRPTVDTEGSTESSEAAHSSISTLQGSRHNSDSDSDAHPCNHLSLSMSYLHSFFPARPVRQQYSADNWHTFRLFAFLFFRSLGILHLERSSSALLLFLLKFLVVRFTSFSFIIETRIQCITFDNCLINTASFIVTTIPHSTDRRQSRRGPETEHVFDTVSSSSSSSYSLHS